MPQPRDRQIDKVDPAIARDSPARVPTHRFAITARTAHIVAERVWLCCNLGGRQRRKARRVICRGASRRSDEMHLTREVASSRYAEGSDLLAALGCPVGGSLVPPIGRGLIRHLGGGRGGRCSPHVYCPGRPPRRQAIREGTKEFKLIKQRGSKRPLGKKWGDPAYHGPSSRC